MFLRTFIIINNWDFNCLNSLKYFFTCGYKYIKDFIPNEIYISEFTWKDDYSKHRYYFTFDVYT